jgi:hypothetical protein
MPTVLRIGPYRFHFYSDERNEPPHITYGLEIVNVNFGLPPSFSQAIVASPRIV